MENVKIINAQRAKGTYEYKNIKEKLWKTNVAIWFSKFCKIRQITPARVV
jgi:hypothetical protein